MKKIYKVIIINLILLLSFIMTACNIKVISPKITHDVNYYIDNTLVSTLKVEQENQVELNIYKIHIEEKNCYMSEYISSIKKDNQTFDGWYYDSNYRNKIESQVATTTVNVYGRLLTEEKTYKVFFNENGGSIIDDMTVVENTVISQTNIPTITKEGCTFGGWYLDSECNTKLGEINVISNITLYAKWNIITYIVTFDTNGGNKLNNLPIKYNNSITLPKEPVKEGYNFIGWYTDKELTQEYTNAKVTSNLTLYAKWEEIPKIIEYTVTFDTKGGNEIESEVVVENTTIDLNDKIPTRTGYVFDGWYIDSDLTTPFDIKTKINSDLTLYAKWEKEIEEIIEYTVTFDTKGGNEIESEVVVENTTIDLEDKIPTRAGYVFEGWYINSGLTTPFDINTKINCNITLYAKWKEEVKYTITFITNGGSSISPLTVKEGTIIEVFDEPIRDGFTFGGWYTNSELTTLFDYNTPITANLTLYAKWNEVIKYSDFSIHFFQLGNYNAGDSIYIKAGDVDILIDAGSKESSLKSITNYIDQYCEDDTLEYVIATHAHEDHIACFATKNGGGIFAEYSVKTIIDFARTKSTSQVYQRYVTARDSEPDAVHYNANECVKGLNGAQKVYQITSDISFEILEQKYYYTSTSNENNNSVCVMFRHVDSYFLFTGDLEESGEESLAALNNLPQVELFKAGHHGSNTSSHSPLLSEIKPKMVVVPCVAGTSEYSPNVDNQFPTQDFINRVAPYTDKIYIPSVTSTNSSRYEAMNGNIVVTSVAGVVGVKCSNNDTILKNSDWFNSMITLNGLLRPMRTWPSNGV